MSTNESRELLMACKCETRKPHGVHVLECVALMPMPRVASRAEFEGIVTALPNEWLMMQHTSSSSSCKSRFKRSAISIAGETVVWHELLLSWSRTQEMSGISCSCFLWLMQAKSVCEWCTYLGKKQSIVLRFQSLCPGGAL